MKELKPLIQQWDYHQTIYFTYIDEKTFEIIGTSQLQISTSSYSILQSVYINEKYRCKGYATKILNSVLKYNDKYIKQDIDLMVRRNNTIIYNKYKKLNFKKTEEDGVYDWLRRKYKEPSKKTTKTK